MDYRTAKSYADKIIPWLEPMCVQLSIVGSIRRHRELVKDVDIVCVPKLKEAPKDLLGENCGTPENPLRTMFIDYVASRKGTWVLSEPASDAKQILVNLARCQLDLWCANLDNYATRQLCRTGSMEHNVWLCQYAKTKGLNWDPYTGLWAEDQTQPDGRKYLHTPTEDSIYVALGLDPIDPVDRELDYCHTIWKP
jgi:DNA polymerase/3'-5' exonuclease PolX